MFWTRVSLHSSTRVVGLFEHYVNHTLANATKPPAMVPPVLLSGVVVVTGVGGVAPDERLPGIERRTKCSIIVPPCGRCGQRRALNLE
jgi:hypothetical protein